METSFTVTKKHIRKSLKLHKERKKLSSCGDICPIALVFKDKGYKEVNVGPCSFTTANNGWFVLPRKVQSWLDEYDDLFNNSEINKKYLDNFQDFTFTINF